MAWTQEQPRVATTIGKIIHFLDDVDGTPPNRSLKFFLQVLDQNGDVMRTLPNKDRPSNDEVPHLTQAQINQLLSFMAARRLALPVDLGFEPGSIVGRCTWRFQDLDGTGPGRSLNVRVIEVTLGGGFVKHQVNDGPNLSQAQINAAMTFLNVQRAKAASEILA